ncbi:MAG: hypothetical protein QOE90_1096 [Thermoplasmata archaeon]|jgi:predicted RNA-binding Zn-ribbon protein involved in translation (DUF1610 family)|nr:hypothetical protein [Thermoplasmata archaeon]
MGVELEGNPRDWGNAQRRVGSLIALGVAVAFLVAALVAYVLSSPSWVYWAFVVVVVLALLFEVALLALQPSRARPMAVAPQPQPQPQPEPQASWAPPPAPEPAPQGVRTLTLRCSDCGTVFDIQDTGERPLRHVCPGCGAEGTLRDEAEPEPQPEPQPPAAPAVKKLKLRCGGCKEVFVIEDTGERPLRRPCPYCGRTGEVR